MAKPRKILVDADALVAIAKEDDSNHQKAVRTALKLKNDTLFVTAFTIPEAVTVISHKISQTDAKKFLAEIRKRNLHDVLLKPELTDLADEIFLSQKTKGTSWADCLNAAVIKSLDLDGIFSFDKFYKIYFSLFVSLP